MGVVEVVNGVSQGLSNSEVFVVKGGSYGLANSAFLRPAASRSFFMFFDNISLIDSFCKDIHLISPLQYVISISQIKKVYNLF